LRERAPTLPSPKARRASNRDIPTMMMMMMMIRAAFVTWLVATVFIVSSLAMIVLYLAFCGYFETRPFEEFEFERAESMASLAFLVAGHVLPRISRQLFPRCQRTMTMSFGATMSYRSPPEMMQVCASPKACRTRALRWLHCRTAAGVGSSLAIAFIGIRAVMHAPNLGGHSCMSSPLNYGDNIILYFLLAAITVLSHAPVRNRRLCKDRSVIS
jgi:hypothetical protein